MYLSFLESSVCFSPTVDDKKGKTKRPGVFFIDQCCDVHEKITLESVKQVCPFVQQVSDECPDSEIIVQNGKRAKNILIRIQPSVEKGSPTKSTKNEAVSIFEKSDYEIKNMCWKCKNSREI